MELTDVKDEDLKRCAEFHGHLGPGVTAGCSAAKYASKLLGFELSEHSNVVCVSENDGCCKDAFKVLLDCCEKNGKLLFDLSDKMAFSFFDKATGKSVKLTLIDRDPELSDDEWLEQLIEKKCDELFEVGEPTYKI